MNTKPPISWQDFEKLDIRVGTIVEVKPFEKARKPAFQVWIDFGELGIKKSSAQITKHYQIADLMGRQIIAVANFPPKQIADFRSECLILGVVGEEGSVILLGTERVVENGLSIG